MLESLKQKLMEFIGLDEFEPATSSDNELITMTQLKSENRRLKGLIDQKNAILQELSQENMDLGRDLQQMADIIARQQRQLDVYKCQLV